MGKLARRAFLIGSAAIAGGVAFGAWAILRDPANPLLADLGEGEASFSPWVKVGPDGIVLIAPHTDTGQGVRHLQAALIAEEMDLEPGQYSVETGPPAQAYWNTALGAAEAEGIQAGVLAIAGKLLGLQVTGGSSTASDSFVKLREAGAVARETLKLAASRAHGVPVGDLRTQAAAVVLPDGRAIPYTRLAAAAADLDPVRDVTLRPPSQWRLIGKELQRLDIVGKSTGTLDYGIDLAMDGMLHASVRSRPQQAGALIRHDAAAALAIPGVAKVVPVKGGFAVIADNSWNAMQAANVVTAEWDAPEFLPEMDQHWAQMVDAFDEDRLDAEWRNDGSVADALAGSDTIQAEYRAPYLAHAPLEPLGALALVGEGRADIWVSHQIPRIAQEKVAEVLGLDTGSVFLHNQYAGGSFGHRLEFDWVEQAAEIAAAMPGTPVKLTYSREQDFAAGYPRHAGVARMRGRAANGRVEALDIRLASPSVTRSQMPRMGVNMPGADSQLAAGVHNAPYAIPHMRVRAYAAQNCSPTSSWRSVGASIGGFFLESALDELIHAAGADPLLERLRLAKDPQARRVLEAVAEMSDWGRTPGHNRGRGVALVESFGVPVAEVVEVTNTEKGIVIDKVFVAAEVGRVLDPVNFENNVAGAVNWGLGHAMNCEITFAGGEREQTNYHAHAGMRMAQSPQIFVRGLENRSEVRGIGEPPVPPAAPALANAIFAATGQRLREMPFAKAVTFA